MALQHCYQVVSYSCRLLSSHPIARPPDTIVGDEADEADGNEKSDKGKNRKKRREEYLADVRGWFKPWREHFKDVSVLSLNQRTTGMLAVILQEMRGGSLSDAAWEALQDRVIGVVRRGSVLQAFPDGALDPRLSHPLSAITLCIMYYIGTLCL